MAMFESSIPCGLAAAVDEFNNYCWMIEGTIGLGTIETVETRGIGLAFGAAVSLGP